VLVGHFARRVDPACGRLQRIARHDPMRDELRHEFRCLLFTGGGAWRDGVRLRFGAHTCPDRQLPRTAVGVPWYAEPTTSPVDLSAGNQPSAATMPATNCSICSSVITNAGEIWIPPDPTARVAIP